MAKQVYLYNSTTGGPTKAIIFNVNKPVLLRAAGLTECVSIYMMVGDCPECHPLDVLWEPVVNCGNIVELCPNNNSVLVSIPGRYSIGNPNTAPLTLIGDVNITKEDGVDPSLVGKCIDTLGDTCDEAMKVSHCGPLEVFTTTPVEVFTTTPVEVFATSPLEVIIADEPVQIIPEQFQIFSGGAVIAGDERSLTTEFAGYPLSWASSSVSGRFQSVTISARGVIDGGEGLTGSQIAIHMPDSSRFAMMNGQSMTFSVVRDQDYELYQEFQVYATGLAYATISYTYIM